MNEDEVVEGCVPSAEVDFLEIIPKTLFLMLNII